MELIEAADQHAGRRPRIVDRLDADHFALEDGALVLAIDEAELDLELVALGHLLRILGRQVRQRDDGVIRLIEVGLDEDVMHLVAGDHPRTELHAAIDLRRRHG